MADKGLNWICTKTITAILWIYCPHPKQPIPTTEPEDVGVKWLRKVEADAIRTERLSGVAWGDDDAETVITAKGCNRIRETLCKENKIRYNLQIVPANWSTRPPVSRNEIIWVV